MIGLNGATVHNRKKPLNESFDSAIHYRGFGFNASLSLSYPFNDYV